MVSEALSVNPRVDEVLAGGASGRCGFEVIEAVQRDALDSMGTMFAGEAQNTCRRSELSSKLSSDGWMCVHVVTLGLYVLRICLGVLRDVTSLGEIHDSTESRNLQPRCLPWRCGSHSSPQSAWGAAQFRRNGRVATMESVRARTAVASRGPRWLCRIR